MLEPTEGALLTDRYGIVIDLPPDTDPQFAAELPRHLDAMVKIDSTLGDRLTSPMMVSPGGARPQIVDGAFGPEVGAV